MIDMYINHAGCVILQVKLWILEKKLTTTSFISIIMVIIIFGPKKNQILYKTTFYRNASQRKINFAVTPS